MVLEHIAAKRVVQRVAASRKSDTAALSDAESHLSIAQELAERHGHAQGKLMSAGGSAPEGRPCPRSHLEVSTW